MNKKSGGIRTKQNVWLGISPPHKTYHSIAANHLFRIVRLIWLIVYLKAFVWSGCLFRRSHSIRTFCLFRLFGLIWTIWVWRDSNPHFTDFKSVASAVGLHTLGLTPSRLTNNRLSLRPLLTFSPRGNNIYIGSKRTKERTKRGQIHT